jgi:hypothetical protein
MLVTEVASMEPSVQLPNAEAVKVCAHLLFTLGAARIETEEAIATQLKAMRLTHTSEVL